ncbi:SdpI family protein [Balneola sp. MJW-20]|uniref:SdpI family protein n=1 Tax=Gracilimonas aurantiaca TaxID=3234185 RepID=UPI003465E7FF
MKATETLKKEWPILILLTLPFIASAFIWEQVPETVPTHFNIHGEADDYGPKWMLLIMIPGIAVLTYLLMVFLPSIDPKRKIESTQKPIAGIRMVITLFFIALYAVTVLIAMGKQVDINTFVTIGIGLLFMILGNYMNSVKPNYFIGIRTPWTLEDPRVWKKTHRLGSKLWLLGGGMLILGQLLFGGNEVISSTVIGVVIVPLAVIPIVYSYILFKKLEDSDD